MTASRQLSRAEIMKLPPTITLATLARALGVSEPTIRRANASGQLAAMGIKVNRLGNQQKVVTSTVWTYLGLTPGASPAPAPGEDTGQRDLTTPRVRFLAPVRAAD